MTDYLKYWADDLLKRSSLELRSSITVVGERNQHLGPRYEFAKIQVRIDPAPHFEVVDAVCADDELHRLGYLDWAIFGLLDILMVSESAPIKKARITLESVEYHSVDSSRMAFRQAGRDAGRKIVEAIKRRI
jgi:hypothetical protein